MSFDTLPDELLEEIFSHLGGKQRVDLSLVNRRWFWILSTPRFTHAVKLRLNTRFGCIPLNVLNSSERVYQHVYCSITDLSDVFVRFTLAERLQHCVQRWNVQILEIHGYYDRMLLFLQMNRNLLEGLRALYIRVQYVYHQHETSYNSNSVRKDDHLVLHLKNLQILHWSYATSRNAEHSLSFVTPQLRRLEVCHLYCQQCLTTVESRMDICSTLTNLQELYFFRLYVNPDEHQLELPYLRKLTIESLDPRGTLILNAPCLIKLIADFVSFNALVLSDANKLRHVELHLCRDCDYEMMRHDARRDPIRLFENHTTHVTKLTLVSHVEDTPFETFSFLLDCFPKIESLHLHQFSLPSSMDRLGPLLKQILITNCTTHARALSFPVQTECVRVYQLQGPREICLFPANMDHPLLDSDDVPAAGAIHSTRGFQYQAKEDGGDYPTTKFGNHNHIRLPISDVVPVHCFGVVRGPKMEVVSE